MVRRFLLTTALAVFIPGLAPALTSAPIAVEIVGVRSASSVIELAVYDSAESFLEDGQSVATATFDASDGRVAGEVLGLPAGRYAIAVFHDENGNDEFDTNFIGLPTEGYGFSNGATVFLGPPAFDDAAFETGAEGARLTVNLSY